MVLAEMADYGGVMAVTSHHTSWPNIPFLIEARVDKNLLIKLFLSNSESQILVGFWLVGKGYFKTFNNAFIQH